jgi:predicted Na+-dependent transporter
LDQLQHCATVLLPALLVIFMAGNLTAVGLELDVRATLAPLRDRRFVLVALACNCLLCPAAAWLIARIFPMAPAYAIGLQLIGLAPAAPFLPMAVRRAGGELAYAAAFMLIGAVGTVILMPIVLPLVAPGLAIDAWTIAKPLVVLLVAPLAGGLAIRASAPPVAARLQRPVRALSEIATLAMLVCAVVVYFDGFVEAINSYAVVTQLLFAVGTTGGAYGFSAGLAPGKRIALSLGVCSRNLGAAFAPLLTANTDARAQVMAALAVPITLIVTFAAAQLFRRHPTDCVAAREH